MDTPMNDWMDAEARVEHAHRLYEDGRWPEAAAELRAAIEINPYNAAWHYNLGLTLEAMEDFPRAGDALVQAAELEKDDVEILNALGVNMTRQGKYAEALDAFARIEKLDPNFEASYCNRIITYTEMAQHDQAELMFYLARQVKDECPLCYYNIGNSLCAREEYERAIDCWKQALRLDPKHPQANARIADAYWSMGELEEARKYYQAELAFHQHDVDTLLDYVDMLVELGEVDEAETQLTEARKVEPENPAVFYCVGELAMRRQDWTTAEEAYRQTMQLDDKYPCVHARLAQVLIRRGLLQEAAKHLLLEIKRAGNNPELLNQLGHLLLEAHLVKHANAVLRRLVELCPEDPHAQHNLAVSYFKNKKLQEGIVHCRRALKLKPDYSLALYNLALAHMKLGQTKRARRYVSKALEISPNDDNIRDLSHKLEQTGVFKRVMKRLTKPFARKSKKI